VVSADEAYRVRVPAVVAEVVDDEVIIINLDTGTYYTLGGAGVLAWAALEQGATPVETAEMVQAAHPDVEPSVAFDSVEALLADLMAEELIEALEPGELADRAPLPLDASVAGAADFTPPSLERYIDMQTLIQLDPVLEVDEHGHPRPDTP
jgi:hypothetical protein